MRSILMAMVVSLWAVPGVWGQGREDPSRPEPRDLSGAIDREDPKGDRVEVPPPTEKALRYYESGNVLWAVNVLWGILVPCLFLFTGLSARVRDWARRLGRGWFLTVGIYFILFSLITYALDWPLAYYQG